MDTYNLLNRFNYVDANPVQYIDHNGHMMEDFYLPILNKELLLNKKNNLSRYSLSSSSLSSLSANEDQEIIMPPPTLHSALASRMSNPEHLKMFLEVDTQYVGDTTISSQEETWEILGSGGFGNVFKNNDKVKKYLYSDFDSNEDKKNMLMAEAIKWNNFFLKAYDGMLQEYATAFVGYDTNGYYMQMPYMGDNIAKIFANNNSSCQTAREQLRTQITNAFHGESNWADIKDDNICLCNKNGINYPVLIDFGPD